MKAQDIYDKREELETETSNYLRSQGWDYSSENPGSLWLWQKVVAGGVIVKCNQETALQLEHSLEQEMQANCKHEWRKPLPNEPQEEGGFCTKCGISASEVQGSPPAFFGGTVKPKVSAVDSEVGREGLQPRKNT